MSKIEWTEELSVGIQEIDGQHKKLVAYINDLDAAMQQGHGKDVIGPILDKLVAYTVEHFGTEEKYFEKFGYAHEAAHKLEHKKFVAQVTDFKKQFDEGSIGLTIPVMQFLSDWLVGHIQGSDRGYTDCFKENGVV